MNDQVTKYIELAKAQGVEAQVHIHVTVGSTSSGYNKPKPKASYQNKGDFGDKPKRPYWEFNGKMYARPEGSLTEDVLLRLGFEKGFSKKGDVQYKIDNYDGLEEALEKHSTS